MAESTRRRVDRLCYAVAAALLVSGLAHLVVAALYPRPWYGPLSWRKPVSFGMSFGTTLAAVTWVSAYLRLTERRRTVLLSVFAADCVVEVTGISVQAWRHVPSHFNTAGALSTVIASLLAVGGGVLIVVLGALAVAAFRTPTAPAMQLALRAGFGLLLAGLAAGVAMIVRAQLLSRGGDVQAAYDHAGFLKWFHAVTLHAVLVLPLLAWWTNRAGYDQAGSVRLVRQGVGCYLAAAAVVLAVCLVQI
jgi:hypothetical protein